jgi:hypothetical protein
MLGLAYQAQHPNQEKAHAGRAYKSGPLFFLSLMGQTIRRSP